MRKTRRMKDPELGERIKTLRREAGMTQNQLANKLNMNVQQVARYEAGGSIPSAHLLAKMAEILEVSTDYLITGYDKGFSKLANITDAELLELFRRVDHLKKIDRDKIKWSVEGMLCNLANGDRGITTASDSSARKIAKSSY